MAPAATAASSTVEAMPSVLDSATEAGPSRQTAPAKRKYEVDVGDREFCKKVSEDLTDLQRHPKERVADAYQLRAEEIELRDRNSVLRTSGGGKVNVSHQIYLLRRSVLAPPRWRC